MRDPAGESVSPSNEQLLLDALCREPAAWKKLRARLDRYVWSIARRRLADLPVDLLEDFVQEVWMRVAARAPEDFDPQSQSASEFVGRFASPAINKVRADYCPPGKRTRDRSPSDHIAPLADVGFLCDERAVAAFGALEARLDVERLMSIATSPVRSGMRLMLRDDLSMTAAARSIPLPRETFRRQLVGLPRELRLARRGRR